jgi:hypothetical protein
VTAETLANPSRPKTTKDVPRRTFGHDNEEGRGWQKWMHDKELCNMEVHTASDGRNFVIMLGSVSFLGHAFFLASFSRTFVCVWQGTWDMQRWPVHRARYSYWYYSNYKILPSSIKFFLFKMFLIIGLKNENSLLSPDGRLQLKCDGTQWHTGGEVKGKLANGVGSQYPSHYLGTWCIQHYYRWCAHLGCQ